MMDIVILNNYTEMLEKITEFLDNKGINDEFLRSIVSEYIKIHTGVFGNTISFESLMQRLDTNLKGIILKDPNKMK